MASQTALIDFVNGLLCRIGPAAPGARAGRDEALRCAKIGRGTFPAAFFFAVMKAIGRENVNLVDV